MAFSAGSGSALLSTAGWKGFASPNNAAAGNAFDRDESTRWSSDAVQTPGMYYGVDLGATHTLTRIIWDDALPRATCRAGSTSRRPRTARPTPPRRA